MTPCGSRRGLLGRPPQGKAAPIRPHMACIQSSRKCQRCVSRRHAIFLRLFNFSEKSRFSLKKAKCFVSKCTHCDGISPKSMALLKNFVHNFQKLAQFCEQLFFANHDLRFCDNVRAMLGHTTTGLGCTDHVSASSRQLDTRPPRHGQA